MDHWFCKMKGHGVLKINGFLPKGTMCTDFLSILIMNQKTCSLEN